MVNQLPNTGILLPTIIKKDIEMSKRKNSEVTSKKAASAAAKVLRDPKSSKAAKTAAGSALTQRPNREK